MRCFTILLDIRSKPKLLLFYKLFTAFNTIDSVTVSKVNNELVDYE